MRKVECGVVCVAKTTLPSQSRESVERVTHDISLQSASQDWPQDIWGGQLGAGGSTPVGSDGASARPVGTARQTDREADRETGFSGGGYSGVWPRPGTAQQSRRPRQHIGTDADRPIQWGCALPLYTDSVVCTAGTHVLCEWCRIQGACAQYPPRGGTAAPFTNPCFDSHTWLSGTGLALVNGNVKVTAGSYSQQVSLTNSDQFYQCLANVP